MRVPFVVDAIRHRLDPRTDLSRWLRGLQTGIEPTLGDTRRHRDFRLPHIVLLTLWSYIAIAFLVRVRGPFVLPQIMEQRITL